MAAKDVRYGRSEKGRERNRRHNRSPFRRLMQCERARQRRALAGYSVHRLIFGFGPQIECPMAPARCECVSHSLIFGILKPENTLLTPEQKVAWQAARDRSYQLMQRARNAALQVWVKQQYAALEAEYPQLSTVIGTVRERRGIA